MNVLETTVWSLLVLAALSTTQTDAFARVGGHHGGHGGDFGRGDFTAGDSRDSDASKYHSVLSHSEDADR